MSKEVLIRVTTSWYCAGMVAKEGVVTYSAPILWKHCVGKPTEIAISNVVKRHRAKVEIIKEIEDGKMDNE